MTTEDARIESLIFWMRHRGDRHLWMCPDAWGSIYKVNPTYAVPVKRIHGAPKLTPTEYRQGAGCPDCFALTGRPVKPLPMYRKHLLDEEGRVVGVVQMSQCMACFTILWAPVIDRATRDAPVLTIVTEKPKRGKKPTPFLKASAQ